MNAHKSIIRDLKPKRFGKRDTIWTISLIVIIVAGIIAYIDQLIKGQEVTNMRDYALWGIYISNFVFFNSNIFSFYS